MKKIMLIASILSILTAPHPAKSKEGNDISRFVDIALNGVYIGNPKSAREVFGKGIKYWDVYEGFYVYNRDKTQLAKFDMHGGDVEYSISEFEVKYAVNSQDKSNFVLDTAEEFVTDNGIKLGLSKQSVIDILGNEFKREKDEGKSFEILKYFLDGDDSVFLQRFKMPIYYGTYVFDKDKLIKFSFGFEYP